MVRIIGTILFLLTMVVSAHGEIRGEPVEYVAGDTTMKGYLAYDDSFPGKRPGILVVHEWWGNNEYTRKRARMLAELGYVALAVDMYGEGKQARHPDDAGKFSGEIRKNMPLGRERFLAARKVLQENKFTDPGRIGGRDANVFQRYFPEIEPKGYTCGRIPHAETLSLRVRTH